MSNYYPTCQYAQYVGHGLNRGYGEQRGILYTCDSDGTERSMEGWFMLSEDGQSVSARKIGGRKRFHYGHERDITQFCRTHY